MYVLPVGWSERSNFISQFVKRNHKFSSHFKRFDLNFARCETKLFCVPFISWRVSITGYLLVSRGFYVRDQPFLCQMFLLRFASVFWYHNMNEFKGIRPFDIMVTCFGQSQYFYLVSSKFVGALLSNWIRDKFPSGSIDCCYNADVFGPLVFCYKCLS